MPDRSLKKFLVVLTISAFVLNIFWELTQVFAFSSLDKASAFEVFILVTIASVADAFITLAAYLFVALLRRNWRWWKSVGVVGLCDFRSFRCDFSNIDRNYCD